MSKAIPKEDLEARIELFSREAGIEQGEINAGRCQE